MFSSSVVRSCTIEASSSGFLRWAAATDDFDLHSTGPRPALLHVDVVARGVDAAVLGPGDGRDRLSWSYERQRG